MSDGEAITSIHDTVGSDFFAEVVEAFYEGVAEDPLLRPMYPEDLAGARARLAMFLVQYWGGPPVYSHHRGHPRLRMRHAPYAVDSAARDAWLSHMIPALHEVARRHETPAEVVAEVEAYFVRAADFLRNTDG